ncbi:MAG TPA: hypothetical protein VM656_08375 [Pyrinomonadaceae bacterium]|nr:hypothetical protein [Pyrinomonadaceae bacterium]
MAAALLGLLLSASLVHGERNPYSGIAGRNVFGLKDPPPPVPFPAPPRPRPAPNLVLTGVADFATAKWAFVTRSDAGQPPKNHTLTFGKAEGGLQLIDLNAKSATVTLLVDGRDTVLLHLSAATNQPAKAMQPAQFSAAGRAPFPRLR